jgi:GNAT superfamily N-acetyltransferase
MAARSDAVLAYDPQGQISIRALRGDDSIEELTRLLHRAYATLARMGLNFTAADQTAEMTRRRVEHAQCFVAVEAEQLVGTILVNSVVPNPLGERFGKPNAASIHQLGVAPQCRGRGVGSRLLMHAESWVGRLGFSHIALDTAESAPQLLAYYVRRGYRSVSSVQWAGKTYRSVIMAKELRASA